MVGYVASDMARKAPRKTCRKLALDAVMITELAKYTGYTGKKRCNFQMAFVGQNHAGNFGVFNVNKQSVAVTYKQCSPQALIESARTTLSV